MIWIKWGAAVLYAICMLVTIIGIVGYWESQEGALASERVSILVEMPAANILDAKCAQRKGLRGGSTYYKFNCTDDNFQKIVSNLNLSMNPTGVYISFFSSAPNWVKQLSSEEAIFYANKSQGLYVWRINSLKTCIIVNSAGL